MDHRLNTRTVYMNPLARFLYVNMNYHLRASHVPDGPISCAPTAPCRNQAPDAATLRWICGCLSRDRAGPDPGSRTIPATSCVAHRRLQARPLRDRRRVTWVRACAVGDIDEEDVRRFDHGGRRYALYHTRSGYYASDGRCTHERADLTKGFVIDEVVECPLHQGRFDIRTGRALGAPVCVDLRVYPVRIEDGAVMIGLLDD